MWSSSSPITSRGAPVPVVHAAVAEHLRGCEGCTAYVGQIRATVAALGAPPPRPSRWCVPGWRAPSRRGPTTRAKTPPAACNGTAAWGDCTGMSSVPIAAHALLSDCHSAALTTLDGSVDWLCFPRFDSPSVFGRLLDDTAGHWSIRPAGEHTSTRRYLDRTLVIETTFRTPTGTVVLTDALATGPDNRGHALGKGAPHLLIRSVT